jgi:hypothetical protein
VIQAELLKIAFETFGIDISNYNVINLPNGISTTQWYSPYLQYALDSNLLDEEDAKPSIGMTREEFIFTC